MDESDGEETDDDLPLPIGAIPKRVRPIIYFSGGMILMPGFKGWACDNKEVQRIAECPNQDIIDKVNLLKLQI